MKLQARQSILDMWRAAAEYSYTKESTWNWGGRRTRNCIGDAEQLLVLLYPATTIASLSIESIDDDRVDVSHALRRLGKSRAVIPRAIIQGAKEYLLRYRDDEGNPTFAGGSYFSEPLEVGAGNASWRETLDVVDAYSMSVTLCLAVLGFAKAYKATVTRESVLEEIRDVEQLSSHRLSAAMVGLLRSFAVHTFDQDSDEGRNMIAMINQSRMSQEAAVRVLNRSLDEVWVGLRENLADGMGESQRKLFEDFDESTRLFECGWSWGVVDGAPEVSYARDLVQSQPTGVAEARPNMYFTVTALDGIRDLFAERTRILGLLTVAQQRLARALQNRLNVTLQFWVTLATLGEAEWPIEDLPWLTTDGSESDYYSLLLCAIVIQGLPEESASGPKARRLARLLEELGMRAKITRRAVTNDAAVALHLPGMSMSLSGSEKLGGTPAQWVVSSFSVLLLKQLVQVAARIEESSERAHLLQQADKVWEHLQARRLTGGEGRELWDAPGNVYQSAADAAELHRPSWYHTERAMEALVQAAHTVSSDSIPGASMMSVASQVLAEAENLLDRELLRGTYASRNPALGDEDEMVEKLRLTLREIQASLRRSRGLLADWPATSMALAQSALRDLDVLAASRQRR
jgi:hypothetical protein